MDLQYQQATDIRVLLEQVSAIEMRTRPGSGPDRGDIDARRAGECPYRGLLPFTESDAQLFYGREVVTAQLVSTVSRRLTSPGPLLVTGASGAGKSSLLRAGLLRAISRGELTEAARDWPRHVMEQAYSPLAPLSKLLAAMAGLDAPRVLSSLSSDPGRSHLLVSQAVETDGRRRGLSPQAAAAGRLVLIVDQFEGVFRYPGGREEWATAERSALITALQAAATVPCGAAGEPAALVVIAVRGDFIDRCASHPDLAVALQRGPFVVGPMTETDLRQTMTGPAGTVGLEIEVGLPDTILSELRSRSRRLRRGVLPLISQTMATIWEHREGQRLTSRGYAKTNGVTHAVATSADASYDSLTESAQELARHVFHQLTTISPNGHAARRTVARTDLYEGCTDHQSSSIDEILDTFARQRLTIVVNAGTVQVAHDTCSRPGRGYAPGWRPTWPSVPSFPAARSRRRMGASPASRRFPVPGQGLAAVRQARTRWDAEPGRYLPLAGTSAEFLAASSKAETRGARLRRTAIAALSAFLAIALVTAVLAIIAQYNATYQRDTAISDQSADESLAVADSRPRRGSRLEAIAAWTIRDSPQTRYAIRAAAANPQITGFNSDTGEINSMAFSPDGTILATGGEGGTTDLWNTTTGKLTRLSTFNVFHAVNSLAFSPDGAVLAIGGDDGNQGLIGFWDVATHRQIGALIDIEVGSVASVAFSPDGKTLAISSGFEGCCVGTGGDSTIQLWNAATHKQIGSALVGTTATADTYSVAFSPNGKILASGGDNGHDATAQLWNVATGRQIGAPILVSPSESVNSVAFSPDGETLATSNNGTVRLWNVISHRHIGAPIPGRPGTSSDMSSSVAFSPDDQTLVTDSGTVQLWNAATHQQIGDAFTGADTTNVTSAVFGPGGEILSPQLNKMEQSNCGT